MKKLFQLKQQKYSRQLAMHRGDEGPELFTKPALFSHLRQLQQHPKPQHSESLKIFTSGVKKLTQEIYISYEAVWNF